MSQIPEDVMKLAEDALRDAVKLAAKANAKHSDWEAARTTIARAILTDREAREQAPYSHAVAIVEALARLAEYGVPVDIQEALVHGSASYGIRTGALAAVLSVPQQHLSVDRKLIEQAHATMRACGWHLAIGAEIQGDGVLEAACAEIEEKFRAALATEGKV